MCFVVMTSHWSGEPAFDERIEIADSISVVFFSSLSCKQLKKYGQTLIELGFITIRAPQLHERALKHTSQALSSMMP